MEKEKVRIHGKEIEGQRNVDFVVCMICQFTGFDISKHIKSRHNLTVKQYKTMFESEDTKCAVARECHRVAWKMANTNNWTPEKNKQRMESMKKTCEKKYGVSNVMFNDEIKNICIKNHEHAFVEKYGVKYMHQVPAIKEKMGKSIRNLWKNPNSTYNSESYKWFGNKQEMSSTEETILSVVPQTVQYVGNHKFVVTFKREFDGKKRKCPDFVVKPFHLTKKVIEVFGDYWHEDWEEKELIEAYQEVGVECLILWESDIKINLKSITEKIYSFCQKPSETARQTSLFLEMKTQSELHSNMQSQSEMVDRLNIN